MISVIAKFAWSLIANFVYAAILAFPLWWVLGRVTRKLVALGVCWVYFSYWDALAVTLGVWLISCAWTGLTTIFKTK